MRILTGLNEARVWCTLPASLKVSALTVTIELWQGDLNGVQPKRDDQLGAALWGATAF